MGKKYYKVVEARKNRANTAERYYSAIACGDFGVEYLISKWVMAPEWLRDKGYNLLVFDDLEAAKRLAKEADYFRIFLVNIEGIEKELPPFRSMLSGAIIGDGKRWPVGTVMVEKVKLTKQVYPKNETKDE